MSNVSMIDGHIDGMSDKNIIKALECCVDCNCKECPCYKVVGTERRCTEIDEEKVLDLINRQQEEIEEAEHNIELLHRLKEGLKEDVNTIRKENEGLLYKIKSRNSEINRLKSIIADTHKIAKAEAITEFAERLKNKMFAEDFLLCEPCDMANIIDDTLKEMVGNAE